jgi:hypothetical protein
VATKIARLTPTRFVRTPSGRPSAGSSATARPSATSSISSRMSLTRWRILGSKPCERHHLTSISA